MTAAATTGARTSATRKSVASGASHCACAAEGTRARKRSIEEWLFNDGPRAMRISAIDKIPDLLERLVKAADKTTKKVQEKTSQALELAAAILKTAEEIELQRKQRHH